MAPPKPPKETAFIPFLCNIEAPWSTTLVRAIHSELGSGAEAIYLAFSSGGGASAEGHAVAAQLRALGAPLWMHNLSHVQSAAVLVYMAGDVRLAAPTAEFSFHRVGSVCNQGEWLDAGRIPALLDKWAAAERRYADYLASRGLTGDIIDWMHSERTMTAQEALAEGLVQEIRGFTLPRDGRPPVYIF
jgi:ATP-dependent protease ClpP protease subunit